MASLVPGYEYEIFISYRQKDNKHDCWVTEFVNNLKGELESTFKEEISVYFDINPHDGLLETHDVNASLKEKLKCLIFIPIISQTYCDPQSFAWQYELVAFNKMAKEDQFGRDIRLAGGNVASRILPVKIHDLDAEDKALFENELGGVLRSIDFIYKSAGVNRPLRATEDHPQDNLNKTYYRDQINKVANAVKEIIIAIKKNNQQDGEISKEVFNLKPEKQKNLKPKIIIVSFIVLALIILGYFFIPKLSKNSDSVEKTIAVLPFRNLTNDTTQLYFCDGFMEELLNNLQKIKSFTVRSRTSSDQYRDTKKSITTIGNELNVNYLVEGSIGREGNNLKIWVQLIDSKADKHVWSNEFLREMTITQIFSLQSEISQAIAAELKAVLTPEEIEKIEKRPTENLGAYNYYLQGTYYYWKSYTSQDWKTAIILYERAIKLDPGFALAHTKLAMSHLQQYWFYHDRSEDVLHISKQLIDKAFEIDPDLSEAHLALGLYYYIGYLEYSKALEQFDLALKKQPGNSECFLYSAAVYRRDGNWEMAKTCFVNAFELDPRSSRIALNTGETFDLLRNYPKALQYFNIAISLNPDWMYPYIELSQLYLQWDGNTVRARELLGNNSPNNKSILTDSLITEVKVLINIYDGKYEEALKDLSQFKSNTFQSQLYFRPKYLYYANIYGLMNKPELERAYYDSTRMLLEEKIIDFPEDPSLYSSLGIAYAGLGLKEKAIITSEKAVRLLPIKKDAWKGTYMVENLAHTYVMIGKYPEAIDQIKYLLTIPSILSTKILELDPRWAPLRNRPEFKKMMESYSVK
jgi:TolB-like protein/Tfp pilus assembly protein PilF